MINKAERLFAQVTMDEARREFGICPERILNVAQNALKVLLNVEGRPYPSTPVLLCL